MNAALYVGTDAGKGGAGLHALYRIGTSGWQVGEAWTGVHNTSFAAWSDRHRLLYLVDEHPDGAVNIVRATSDGWQKVGRVATSGAAPCYVALNRAQDRLAVANYGDGSVALFLLDDRTGLPRTGPVVHRRSGSGPVAGRQDGAHAHCVCFSHNDRWLYHADLGADVVLSYLVNAAAGEPHIAFAASAGSGPRHLVLHPTRKLAALVSELANTLTILAVDGAILRPLHVLSTLPTEFSGESIAGHVALNAAGDRLYVTNRGHDSVAVFAWAPDAVPMLLQHAPSGGAGPRAFVLLEAACRFVLANEDGHNVVMFDIRADGTLSPPDVDLSVRGAVFPFVVA